MTFGHPAAFWLLLLPAAAIFWRWRARRLAAGAIEIPSLPPRRSGWRATLVFLPGLLSVLAVLAAIVALAHPQKFRAVPVGGRSGIDIAVALDVSGSMQAEDFEPTNRLDVARSVVRNFIEGRPNDRIALLAFAGAAETICPATTQRRTLLSLLAGVNGNSLPDGTAIGNAIATGVARLKDLPGKSKVILLVTDGGNNAGQIDPVTAARIARAYGIRIHTIAVGRGGRVPIVVTYKDPDTGQTFQRRIEADVEVDTDLLKRIAAATGGDFFRARDSAALRQIFHEIDRMEKTNAPGRFELVPIDLSQTPLTIAALLLSLSLLLAAGPLRLETEAV